MTCYNFIGLVSFVLLYYCLAIAQLISSTQHPFYVSDVCDWQGSGSPNIDSDRSVVPIYLRCSRGNVKWLYPKGGLRVVLKLGSTNKDFHGCIRVTQNSTRNIRIYLEGKRQLHQIYSADDGKHKDLFRCFISVNSFIAIFIETELNVTNNLLNKDHIMFSYDLQAMDSSLNDLEDCRPCNDKQLLSFFCSGDFALSGRVIYYHNRPELDMTEFNVKPTYMYRFPINSAYVNDFNASKYSVSEDETSPYYQDVEVFSQITLQRPLKCMAGAAARTEYLFIGRKVLDNYVITCAPKLSYWKKISKKAVETGTNQCHMS